MSMRETAQIVGFPGYIAPDIRIRPEGAVLEAIELADFIPLLSIASDISEQIKERTDLPFLNQIACHLTGFPDIRVLKRSIDTEGNILDSASSLLLISGQDKET